MQKPDGELCLSDIGQQNHLHNRARKTNGKGPGLKTWLIIDINPPIFPRKPVKNVHNTTKPYHPVGYAIFHEDLCNWPPIFTSAVPNVGKLKIE
jgi:hypothetical protein